MAPQNPRVRIEPLHESHRDRFLVAVANSRGLHADWVSPATDDNEFAEYLKRNSATDHAAFLVIAAGADELAGAINISHMIHGALCSGFLGYYAFEPFAGKGFMREGLRLVAAEAFSRLGLHRLEANIQPGNEASIALVKQCGFRLEGFSPRYLKIAGEWRDHQRWAILADEFGKGTGKLASSGD